VADLQKEHADLKRMFNTLHRDYVLLSGKYGEMLRLLQEDPCEHPAEANCWHKYRNEFLLQFKKEFESVQKATIV